MTPNAATPSSPQILMSWRLYTIDIRDTARLLISSDIPFVQVFASYLKSVIGLPSRSRLELRTEK